MPTPASEPRLLVTEDAPAYAVLAAVRALRGAGYAPWIAVTGRDAYSWRSRARAGVVEVPDPARDRDGYVAALARAAEQLAVTAVMPGTEVGLVALADARDAFPPQTALGTMDPETVRRATDKVELGRLAAEAGLAAPATTPTTRAELESDPSFPLPAVVKAPRTRTPTQEGGFVASPVRHVTSRAQLLDAVAAVPGGVALVQPALEGELTAVCGVSWRGEVVAATHQVSRRIFPPGCGISAFAQTVPPDAALEAGVARLIAALGWSGIFQAQFIRSQQTSYLIDLNPRMYGSLALAVAAGVNLPAIWADLLLDCPPLLGPYRVGARFRSEERDLALLGAAILGGDWRTALDVLRPHRGTTHAVFSARDPLPVVALGRKLGRARRILTRSAG